VADADGFDFSPARRVREAREYSAVFAWRRVVRGSLFDLHYRPGDGSEARLGLVIAKKLARRAVLRNAIKRVARETFRHLRPTLPPLDLVLRLAKPGATPGTASRRIWRAEIEALFGRLPATNPGKTRP
jgi:ribonuclease P protein component